MEDHFVTSYEDLEKNASVFITKAGNLWLSVYKMKPEALWSLHLTLALNSSNVVQKICSIYLFSPPI